MLRQGQLASHPQLKFQERRKGHALVACWNSFEDEARIKRFRRKNTEVTGGLSVHPIKISWFWTKSEPRDSSNLELLQMNVEGVVQGRKLKATMKGSFKEELKSRQNALPNQCCALYLLPEK